MSVLSSQQIRELLSGPEPLVSHLIDIETQLQPNGIDLTLASIESFSGQGQIGRDNSDRVLASTTDLAFDIYGYVKLNPGVYLARLTETVSLPKDVMAIAKPRSSLLRNGVSVNNAVWDAGYIGQSQVQIVVDNPFGFSIAQRARIVQMVFLRLDSETDAPYRGIYQHENLDRADQ